MEIKAIENGRFRALFPRLLLPLLLEVDLVEAARRQRFMDAAQVLQLLVERVELSLQLGLLLLRDAVLLLAEELVQLGLLVATLGLRQEGFEFGELIVVDVLEGVWKRGMFSTSLRNDDRIALGLTF